MPDPATGLTTCCWEWLGARSKGYGNFWYESKSINAHRFAWLLDGRPLPEKPLTLDHLCWNKACVRLDHLRVATQSQQNMNTDLRSRKPGKSNTSGVRGVGWNKQKAKWKVVVWFKSNCYFGGYFNNLESANAAAQALRKRLHGS
jgi:hypothetical protein